MITVTEDAKEVLMSILIASEAEPVEGLRLLPTPNGTFALVIGTELSGDQVVEHKGFKVLLVGLEYYELLNGKEIDCDCSADEPVIFVR